MHGSLWCENNPHKFTPARLAIDQGLATIEAAHVYGHDKFPHYYTDRALLSHRLDRHHVRERGVWFLDPSEKEDAVSGGKG